MSPHELLSKANEITKDTHSSTNIYVEGQTIDYITNPSRFKEDLGKAKQEIKDIGTAIKESINDRGDDNRNFLGQLGEGRLRTTIDNIAGKRLENAKDQNEIGRAFEDAYKDLGYNAKVIYTDPSKAPQLIDESGNIKSGTAYVGKDGVHTIIINTKDPKNSTRSGIIGTISEEGSYIIGKIEGRQLQTGTEEKGLESTGRATNEYFTDKYKKNDIPIEAKSDGKDYSSTDFGENVGDDVISIHGGARAKTEDVDGPRKKYQEEGILKKEMKKEVDFSYNVGVQFYTEKGVKKIAEYRHKKDSEIIVWSHSLGADSTLEAYGIGYREKRNKLDYSSDGYPTEITVEIVKVIKPQKANELNIVMPRVDFIQKYITQVSKNSENVNIFILKKDKGLKNIHDYGDRSYETLEKKIKTGEIKVPKNVKIIPLDPISKDNIFFPLDYTVKNHAPALNYGNPMFEQIWKKYKESGSKYAK